jgi:pimeloyl-ACP methyl ester carboxylesterase
MADCETISVGTANRQRAIAVRRRAGAAPGLFWLGGFRSDMTGAKATTLDAVADRLGLAATRFDYSGHGSSGGRFEDASISDWLEESRAVFATTAGPQVVVGSSMGGWLALLLALSPEARARVGGLVLVAPATDFTERLMLPHLDAAAHAALAATGRAEIPSGEGGSYPLTRRLLDDGRSHLLLGGPIAPPCPVRILQGSADGTVPIGHALTLVDHLVGVDVTLTVVAGGDHRLSRPDDLDRLARTIEAAVADIADA